MVRVHEQGLLGNKPYFFRQTPSRRLSIEVWAQHYTLISPDSFEIGSAYSLHPTPKQALKFRSPFSWYQKTGGEPKIVYVSPITLEKILKEKKHAIFEDDN